MDKLLLSNFKVYNPNKKVLALFKKAFKSHPKVFSTFNCLKPHDKDNIIKLLLNVITLRINKKPSSRSKKVTKPKNLNKLKGGSGRVKKLRKRTNTKKANLHTNNNRWNSNSDYNPSQNSNESNNTNANSYGDVEQKKPKRYRKKKASQVYGSDINPEHLKSLKKLIPNFLKKSKRKSKRKQNYQEGVSGFLGSKPGIYNSPTLYPGWNYDIGEINTPITAKNVFGGVKKGHHPHPDEYDIYGSSSNTEENEDMYPASANENEVVERYMNHELNQSRQTPHTACKLQQGLKMLNNLGSIGENLIGYIKGHIAPPLEKGELGTVHRLVPEGLINLDKIYGVWAEDIQNLISSDSELGTETKENNNNNSEPFWDNPELQEEQRNKTLKSLLPSIAALLMSIMVMYFFFIK
jgi:hypothetical protein